MCGFFGVVGKRQAAREIFIALQTLQHRGQDSAGIATKDGSRFPVIKEMGTVPHALAEGHLESASGPIGLGHVRYPTFGRAVKEDAQPFFYRQPGVLMAHNGNITNYESLSDTLAAQSVHLLSTCDIEPVLCLFANALMDRRRRDHTIDDAVYAFERVRAEVTGAYSVVGVAELDGEDTLFTFRDPRGIRPAVWGEREGAFAVASESVALDALGYEYRGDVGAGEIIFFRAGKPPVRRRLDGARPHAAACIFEHIYFARPDSIIDGKTVYEVRLALGRQLAEEWKSRGLDVDTVIPVPDTSRPAATALGESLGKPIREGFIKNRYSGRTFIMPDQVSRTSALRLKLNPIRSEIEDKRVLLVDDSIVRGNTVRSIIALVRTMRPREVHLAIFSPPVTHPCYYGIDMSMPSELVARRHLGIDFAGPLSLERQRAYEDALARELNLDSLTHLSHAGLDAVGTWPKCAACFTGRYPEPLSGRQRAAIEEQRSGNGRACDVHPDAGDAERARGRRPNALGEGVRPEPPPRSAFPAPAFVFFDAGNTLITSRYRIDTVYASTFRRHGAALPDGDAAREMLGPVISTVWGSIQDSLTPGQNRYALAGDSDRTFWRRFVDQIADRAELELDRHAAFEELYAYYSLADAWDVYEDVRPALDTLRAAGVRMGIISNWDARLPRLLETLGLAGYMDPIVVSAIEGVEKPSPDLFLRAAERAGVAPETCVHIGDSEPLDVLGARAAGMHPLLILRGRAGTLASAMDSPRERTTDAEVVRDLRTLAERIRAGA